MREANLFEILEALVFQIDIYRVFLLLLLLTELLMLLLLVILLYILFPGILVVQMSDDSWGFVFINVY